MAARTVRLRVHYTSWDRPDGYSFSGHRGSDIPHTGSGWVRNVDIVHGPCPCPECSQSSAPSQDWFRLHVETACHVVFNTEEARATKVDFFYDDAKSRVEEKMQTIRAIKILLQDEKADTCTLVCATHSQLLGSELLQCLKETEKIKFFGPPTVWSLP
ncbi:hypothetical protein EGW08_007012, partial [Elysia chlorotica]